jgi:hypothetical protein
MAYCTIEDLRKVLPKTITIGDNNMVNSDTIVTQGKPDTLSTRSAQIYIDQATQDINGWLRTIYFCPLRRIKAVEETITTNVAAGADILYVHDAAMFNVTGLIRISDGTNTETSVITEMFQEDPTRLNQMRIQPKLSNSYSAASPTYVSLLRFPDPIPIVCARIAAANIIDRLFVTEKAPDVPTGYGKGQRSKAMSEIDAVLAGAIRLEGQDFNSKRFVRMSLFDTMKSGTTLPPGQGKES